MASHLRYSARQSQHVVRENAGMAKGEQEQNTDKSQKQREHTLEKSKSARKDHSHKGEKKSRTRRGGHSSHDPATSGKVEPSRDPAAGTKKESFGGDDRKLRRSKVRSKKDQHRHSHSRSLKESDKKNRQDKDKEEKHHKQLKSNAKDRKKHHNSTSKHGHQRRSRRKTSSNRNASSRSSESGDRRHRPRKSSSRQDKSRRERSRRKSQSGSRRVTGSTVSSQKRSNKSDVEIKPNKPPEQKRGGITVAKVSAQLSETARKDSSGSEARNRDAGKTLGGQSGGSDRHETRAEVKSIVSESDKRSHRAGAGTFTRRREFPEIFENSQDVDLSSQANDSADSPYEQNFVLKVQCSKQSSGDVASKRASHKQVCWPVDCLQGRKSHCFYSDGHGQPIYEAGYQTARPGDDDRFYGPPKRLTTPCFTNQHGVGKRSVADVSKDAEAPASNVARGGASDFQERTGRADEQRAFRSDARKQGFQDEQPSPVPNSKLQDQVRSMEATVVSRSGQQTLSSRNRGHLSSKRDRPQRSRHGPASDEQRRYSKGASSNGRASRRPNHRRIHLANAAVSGPSRGGAMSDLKESGYRPSRSRPPRSTRERPEERREVCDSYGRWRRKSLSAVQDSDVALNARGGQAKKTMELNPEGKAPAPAPSSKTSVVTEGPGKDGKSGKSAAEASQSVTKEPSPKRGSIKRSRTSKVPTPTASKVALSDSEGSFKLWSFF